MARRLVDKRIYEQSIDGRKEEDGDKKKLHNECNSSERRVGEVINRQSRPRRCMLRR